LLKLMTTKETIWNNSKFAKLQDELFSYLINSDLETIIFFLDKSRCFDATAAVEQLLKLKKETDIRSKALIRVMGGSNSKAVPFDLLRSGIIEVLPSDNGIESCLKIIVGLDNEEVQKRQLLSVVADFCLGDSDKTNSFLGGTPLV